MRAQDLPWNDRTGQFSPLRLGTFLGVLMPALWLIIEAFGHRLGPRPDNEAIHESGLWAIRLLAVTLAVTPLRYAMRFNRLIGLRRMLGLSALSYALLHLALYGLLMHGNLARIASEIVLRIYLTIGFVALWGLIVLGLTSTDGMIRRLGSQRWGRLHKSVYAIAALGTVHFFMQSKLDVSEPIMMGGIFGLLLGERLLRRLRGDHSVLALSGLAVTAAVGTACCEATWYSFKTGAPMLMILAANLDFSYAIRPAWYVLGAGVLLASARALRPLFAGARQRLVPNRTPVVPLPACGER